MSWQNKGNIPDISDILSTISKIDGRQTDPGEFKYSTLMQEISVKASGIPPGSTTLFSTNGQTVTLADK